jgi:hypothetical protein
VQSGGSGGRLTQDGAAARQAELRFRIDGLARLRKLVGLPASRDIPREQWALIEAQLDGARRRLLARVAETETALALGRADRHELVDELGGIELALTRAYTLFDTYMDVLTQRLAPDLGSLLAGCDTIAADAMRRPHPTLAKLPRPLVYCDRGFGASYLREGVLMPDGSLNPLPLIQIPYARLREKHTLPSILHEAGHAALHGIGLREPLAAAMRTALTRTGAPPMIADAFARWTRELGPDFWTFGLAGAAQASTLRDLLSIPRLEVLRLAPGDPHPPPWLRVLSAFDWCRRAWGAGPWHAWEEAWLADYPLAAAPPNVRSVLDAARRAIPAATTALFTTRFRTLDDRSLPELFDLAALAPSALAARVRGVTPSSVEFAALRPCEQLAVFRWLHDTGRHPAERLDEAMTAWLQRLGTTSRG